MPTTAPSPSPFSMELLVSELEAVGVTIPTPVVLPQTASTNDEAAALATAGAPQWSLVVADHQSAGRGRLGRSWQAPAGTALMFSVILRPPTAWTHELGWIPLTAGHSVARAIDQLGVPAKVKWPNDIVVTEDGANIRKLGGILAERRDTAVIVGVGINVGMQASQLPVETATSLQIEGIQVSREVVLARALACWQLAFESLVAAGGDANRSGLSEQYQRECVSLGRRVRVDSPKSVEGVVVGIDDEGHLIVDADGTHHQVTAGDVQHLL